MRFKKLNCPCCEGSIVVDIEGQKNVFCSYCGQQILLDDEKREFTFNKNISITKTIHKRYTDDAEVIKEINRAKEERRTSIGVLLYLIISVLLLSLMIAIPALNEAKNKSEGKICAGYYGDLVGEDYRTVEAHFRSAGFINIELINLDDAGIMFWNKGKVETISVGGDTSFNGDDWFAPDTKVVIAYH